MREKRSQRLLAFSLFSSVSGQSRVIRPISSGRSRTRSDSSRARAPLRIRKPRSTPCAGPARCRPTSSGAPSGRLNDPDCKDSSSPDRCAATAGKRYQQSRLGWAAQTLNDNCYEVNGKPRRYSPICDRKLFVGQCEGRLHPARRAHGDDTDRARAACRRHRRLRLELAAAQGRQDRDANSSPARTSRSRSHACPTRCRRRNRACR